MLPARFRREQALDGRSLAWRRQCKDAEKKLLCSWLGQDGSRLIKFLDYVGPVDIWLMNKRKIGLEVC